MDEIKEKIEAVFAQAKDQYEALNGIYGLWRPADRPVSWRGGRPVCGPRLYHFVARKFQTFDYHHHPRAWPGALWLAQGFRLSRQLGDWQVRWPDQASQRTRSECFA